MKKNHVWRTLLVICFAACFAMPAWAAAENMTVTAGVAAENTTSAVHASAGSTIATTAAAGSATDPSTALLEKQAAEQAEAAALAAQIAQEEAAGSGMPR